MRLHLISLVASALAITIALPALAQVSPNATFAHQVRRILQRGGISSTVDGTIVLSQTTLVFKPRKPTLQSLTVTYESIVEMVYDRRSKVRLIAPQYGKAEGHFLTIQYITPNGDGDYIELELGKSVAPGVINTLRARSGKNIERTSGS